MTKINEAKINQEPDDHGEASTLELLSMVREAAERIRDSIYYSPCPYPAELSASTCPQIYLKLDTLHIPGADQTLAPLNTILLLSSEERHGRVISPSAATRAQALAHVATR